MRKITVSIMAVMALTGACMVSFAANDSPAYQVWAHRSAPAMRYMMSHNSWCDPDDEDYDDWNDEACCYRRDYDHHSGHYGHHYYDDRDDDQDDTCYNNRV